MITKDLRNGKFFRCFDNDLLDVEMDVEFTNTEVIEPFIEVSLDNVLNLSLKELNRNYNLMRNTFVAPLINNENPIKVTVEYDCSISGDIVSVRQDITNLINFGNNGLSLLDIYTDGGSTLQSVVSDNPYTIVGNFKFNAYLKKLPQVQLPYLDFVLHHSPFFSNISVIF